MMTVMMNRTIYFRRMPWIVDSLGLLSSFPSFGSNNRQVKLKANRFEKILLPRPVLHFFRIIA